MHPALIPVGVGVVALGGIGLRLRAMAKAKLGAAKTAPAAASLPKPAPAPLPQSPVIDPKSVAFVESLPKLVNNPDGSPHVVGTPFVAATTADAQDIVAEANRRGISVAQVLLERSGQLAPSNSGDGVAAAGQKAIVTTNDPPPSGDLIVRGSPDASADKIGGADKGGTVTVLDSSDPVFARISWSGGRWPACEGFAKKQFLKLI